MFFHLSGVLLVFISPEKAPNLSNIFDWRMVWLSNALLPSEVWVRAGSLLPAWWGQGGVGSWGTDVLLVPTTQHSVLDELVKPYCFKDPSLEWA